MSAQSTFQERYKEVIAIKRAVGQLKENWVQLSGNMTNFWLITTNLPCLQCLVNYKLAKYWQSKLAQNLAFYDQW